MVDDCYRHKDKASREGGGNGIKVKRDKEAMRNAAIDRNKINKQRLAEKIIVS